MIFIFIKGKNFLGKGKDMKEVLKHGALKLFKEGHTDVIVSGENREMEIDLYFQEMDNPIRTSGVLHP